MGKRPVIYPDDQAMVVVVRPNGDPGVFLNPKVGFTPDQAAEILESLARRLRAEYSQQQAP